jgi:hypothetical protein
MNFLELIIVFWIAVFFVSGSYLGRKSYKRKKELHNLINN